MPVNQRIITVRKYYKFEQNDFADAISIAQPKISKIERGLQKVDLEVLSAVILKFKEVDSEWLIGNKGYDNQIIFKGNEPSFDELERIEKERDEQKRRAEEAERKNMVMMEELLKYKIKENEELKADRALSPQPTISA